VSSNHHSWAHLVLPMRTNGHRQARPAVPMKTDGHLRAHLLLPMKTCGRRQLCLAHPKSPSRQPHRVLARKFKGMGVAGAEKMGVQLPMPLQTSAEKSNAK
jgi:hypothetical protein